MPEESSVNEMRIVVTTDEFAEAVTFYRDALGLVEVESFTTEDGAGTVLQGGVATLELLETGHAEWVDQVEVGQRVAGHIRLAFGVDDTVEVTDRLESAGAHIVARPVVTPWDSHNSRLEGPAGLQLTIFSDLA